MRKPMRKSITGAAVCLALAHVLCVSSAAIDMEGEMISEDRDIDYTEVYRNSFDGEVRHSVISEDAELVFSVPGLMVYETTTTEEHTATFSTSFNLIIRGDDKSYAGGAASVYSGGSAAVTGGAAVPFGEDGSRVGENGVSYEPPFIGALLCGAGYLLCSGLKGYVFKLKRKAT